MAILLYICIIWACLLQVSVDTTQYNVFFAWILDFLTLTGRFCFIAFCYILLFKINSMEQELEHKEKMERIKQQFKINSMEQELEHKEKMERIKQQNNIIEKTSQIYKQQYGTQRTL